MDLEARLKIRKAVLKKDTNILNQLSKEDLIEYIQDTNAITVLTMQQLFSQI